MPKLAIYVPKKDWREIEKWRKQINFSQVFMQALFREIRDRSRNVQPEGDKLTAAAEFYRQQLAQTSEPLVDFGFQQGSEDVLECRLSPGAIQQIAKLSERDELQREDVSELKEVLGDQAEKLRTFAQQHNYTDQSCPNWREILYLGYAQGVAAAWRKICDKLNTD